MLNRFPIVRDPYACAFPDPKITSSIDLADRKSNRFGEEFYVVQREGEVSVVTEYELTRQKSFIQSVIYSTANGFQFSIV